MSTISKPSYRWLLWALAFFGFALDQVGKYGVFKLLYDEALTNQRSPLKAEQLVIPGALKFHVELSGEQLGTDASVLRTWSGEIQPHVNRGAFLGFGSGRWDFLGFGGGHGDGEGANGNLIFAIVSVLAAGAIIWWSTRRSIARDGLLCAALGLILGGTLGNLYDRIVFDGVRDYLYWFFLFNTAVFNIADFFLICGALLLLVQAFWGKSIREPAPETAAAREVANQRAEAGSQRAEVGSQRSEKSTSVL